MRNIKVIFNPVNYSRECGSLLVADVNNVDCLHITLFLSSFLTFGRLFLSKIFLLACKIKNMYSLFY